VIETESGALCAKQLFLRGAAPFDELRQARRRQARLLLCQTRLDQMRQREVHVVAAKHQMVAYADARQLRLAILEMHLDECEVRRAAAHIADEHEARLREFGAKRRAMMKQPVVENGLRLFEQAQRGQLRDARGLKRERTCAIIERCRNGKHYVLIFEQRVRKTAVPRGTHVSQIAGARGHRRDLADFIVRAPRQNWRETVDRRMREPAFRARHQPSRHLRAQRAREMANYRRLRLVLASPAPR
jgi:hypothetical protein